MIGVPVSLFALIAVLAFTPDVSDFFVVGRRVPAFFSGLGLAITALGSVGTLSLTGLLFHNGYDAVALIVGFMGGMVLIGLVVASFYRKFGAYSVPGYLGGRFDRRSVRMIAALMMIVPCFLFLLAEIQIGARILGMVLERSQDIAIISFIGTLVFMIVWGEMRGLIWTNGAQGIVAIVALLVLPIIAALVLTNLPLPQITYETLLDDLARFEIENGISSVSPQNQGLDQLLDMEPKVLQKPFLQAMGAIDRIDFFIIILTIMAGISAAPHLLSRLSVSPGVTENRRSIGWACLLLGLILLTLPAIAVFVRYSVFDRWIGLAPDQLPHILDMLSRGGLVNIDQQVVRLGINDLKISRDGALLIFPMVLNFPDIFTYLLLTSLIALAVAGAGAQLMTLSTMIVLDIAYIADDVAHHTVFQTLLIRMMMIVVGVLAGWVVLNIAGDPVQILLYGLQISGSAGFPILILSVWWKRINYWGALAAMVFGFGVTLAYIILIASGLLSPVYGVDPRLAGIFGMPAGFLMGMIVSMFTPKAEKSEIELVRDMRIPGGETLYDRTMRYARLKAQREKLPGQ